MSDTPETPGAPGAPAEPSADTLLPAQAEKPMDPEALALLIMEKDRKKRLQMRRKKRDAEGEIKELNITAMMDMMTIILVFLLKSYSASALNVTQTEDLRLPASLTQQNPKEAVNVTISMKELVVNDKRIIPVQEGRISAEYLEGQSGDSMMIPAVHAALEKEVEKQKFIAQHNPNAPFEGRINIIADKRLPYRSLMAVLYTAGQAELGQYKLMAIKNE